MKCSFYSEYSSLIRQSNAICNETHFQAIHSLFVTKHVLQFDDVILSVGGHVLYQYKCMGDRNIAVNLQTFHIFSIIVECFRRKCVQFTKSTLRFFNITCSFRAAFGKIIQCWTKGSWTHHILSEKEPLHILKHICVPGFSSIHCDFLQCGNCATVLHIRIIIWMFIMVKSFHYERMPQSLSDQICGWCQKLCFGYFYTYLWIIFWR